MSNTKCVFDFCYNEHKGHFSECCKEVTKQVHWSGGLTKTFFFSALSFFFYYLSLNKHIEEKTNTVQRLQKIALFSSKNTKYPIIGYI